MIILTCLCRYVLRAARLFVGFHTPVRGQERRIGRCCTHPSPKRAVGRRRMKYREVDTGESSKLLFRRSDKGLPQNEQLVAQPLEGRSSPSAS